MVEKFKYNDSCVDFFAVVYSRSWKFHCWHIQWICIVEWFCRSSSRSNENFLSKVRLWWCLSGQQCQEIRSSTAWNSWSSTSCLFFSMCCFLPYFFCP